MISYSKYFHMPVSIFVAAFVVLGHSSSCTSIKDSLVNVYSLSWLLFRINSFILFSRQLILTLRVGKDGTL